MSNSHITQSHNYTSGDIAGNNITKTIYQQSSPSALRELAQKFRLESEQDAQLSSFIARLQHFMSEAPGAPSRDLSTKLEAAGRMDLVPEALLLKEQFTKKLLRLQFSEQAVEIFAHVLSKIHAFFVYKVRPKHLAGASRDQIDELIYNDLLTAVYDEVGSCKLIDLTDLQGMVYFLGGNCHIRWD
jgi:hypothetical protein